MPPESQTPHESEKEKPEKKAPSKEGFFDYFKQNARESIAYALLIIGIVLIIPYPLIGGLLVGLVAGAYFSTHIIDVVKRWNVVLKQKGDYGAVAENIILLGIAIAFLLAAPSIFLGAAISIGIKQLFIGQT